MCRRSCTRLVLLLLCAAACARHGTPGTTAPAGAAAAVLLVVENHHWNDVVIHLLHDGVADRIGLARAVEISTFVIPARQLGTGGAVQLRAHPVGAPDSYTTDLLTVRPGQQIQWTLESDLTRSSVGVH
jgi:hypothetical protein